MTLTVDLARLHRGIERFRARGNWDRDFHDDMYRRLTRNRSFDGDHWRRIVGELVGWKAYRGVPGFTREHMEERGAEVLPVARAQYGLVRRAHGSEEPELGDAHWGELVGLFGIARDLKGVDSPVFASKMCHFILPNCFPVLDNLLMETIGCSDYPTYWQACHDGWLDCPDREQLVRELRNEIPGGVFEGYPWATKITELCAWGVGVPAAGNSPIPSGGRRIVSVQETGPVEVGDILISDKGDYHFVVTGIDGNTAHLLWVERTAGEPIAFYTYRRGVDVRKTTSYYDLVKRAKVNLADYRAPKGGWPE